MKVLERLDMLRRDCINCGCSGCREFRRVTTHWADLIQVDYEREQAEASKAKCADLDALERACEEVLDGDTLKAVMQAKRRFKKGGAE